MKRYENLNSARLIENAIGNAKINVSELARAIGVCTSNIWFYLNGERKWALETWLDVLAYLGLLEYDGHSITIHVEIPSQTQKHFFYLQKAGEKARTQDCESVT